ncbi:permease YjgP/YjgQ family protein, partial [mine drainage metagenome]
MNGIFIYEKPAGKDDTGSVIIAKEGHLENEINPPGLRLKLTSGTLYREGTYQQFVRFDSYDLTILGSIPKGRSSHIPTISELQKKIRESKNPKSDDLRQLEDRYKNYTYPFSCIIFAFMGIPFGIYAKRSGKLSGFVFATTSVIVFYMLNTIDDLLVARKLLSPSGLTHSRSCPGLSHGVSDDPGLPGNRDSPADSSEVPLREKGSIVTILSKYIASELFKIFLISAVSLEAIYGVIDSVEKLKDFFSHHAPL